MLPQKKSVCGFLKLVLVLALLTCVAKAASVLVPMKLEPRK